VAESIDDVLLGQDAAASREPLCELLRKLHFQDPTSASGEGPQHLVREPLQLRLGVLTIATSEVE
jgi:hypothetical protein